MRKHAFFGHFRSGIGCDSLVKVGSELHFPVMQSHECLFDRLVTGVQGADTGGLTGKGTGAGAVGVVSGLTVVIGDA